MMHLHPAIQILAMLGILLTGVAVVTWHAMRRKRSAAIRERLTGELCAALPGNAKREAKR